MNALVAVILFFAWFSGGDSFAQCPCVPPSQVIMGVCQVPANPPNACDDGSLSGIPSLVAASVTGATAQAKFQSLINKKLACCLNSFDKTALSAPLKFDCVDNSAIVPGSTFDTLWTGTDNADSGGQSDAVALSAGGNGSIVGKVMTGFYTLSGNRCAEFSEFAGTIHDAKVNPGQISAQQNTSGGGSACAITPGGYSVVPPAQLSASVIAAGKKIPYDGTSTTSCTQVADMRRCPILVRAAMIATCPKTPSLPFMQTSYVDALGVTHCLAASSIRFHIRMEQIYEISGTPKMEPVDTLADMKNGGVTVSVSSLISSKVGNFCPGPNTLYNNTCAGPCPDGCGNSKCTPCPINTYYQNSAGHPQCNPCPAGLHTVGPGFSICT